MLLLLSDTEKDATFSIAQDKRNKMELLNELQMQKIDAVTAHLIQVPHSQGSLTVTESR